MIKTNTKLILHVVIAFVRLTIYEPFFQWGMIFLNDF